MTQDLVQLREQIQEDIITIMDGFDDSIIDALCQCVIDNFNMIESK